MKEAISGFANNPRERSGWLVDSVLPGKSDEFDEKPIYFIMDYRISTCVC
jgi:hypothetical protein